MQVSSCIRTMRVVCPRHLFFHESAVGFALTCLQQAEQQHRSEVQIACSRQSQEDTSESKVYLLEWLLTKSPHSSAATALLLCKFTFALTALNAYCSCLVRSVLGACWPNAVDYSSLAPSLSFPQPAKMMPLWQACRPGGTFPPRRISQVKIGTNRRQADLETAALCGAFLPWRCQRSLQTATSATTQRGR